MVIEPYELVPGLLGGVMPVPEFVPLVFGVQTIPEGQFGTVTGFGVQIMLVGQPGTVMMVGGVTRAGCMSIVEVGTMVDTPMMIGCDVVELPYEPVALAVMTYIPGTVAV